MEMRATRRQHSVVLPPAFAPMTSKECDDTKAICSLGNPSAVDDRIDSWLRLVDVDLVGT
jgi:hypothetical protein